MRKGPYYSPLRFPGGKSWLLPEIGSWLRALGSVETLLEPFAGGASASLFALSERLVKRAIIVEIDPDLACFWKAIFFGDAEKLANKVRSTAVNGDSMQELLSRRRSTVDRAFAVLLRNRLNRAGILAPGAGLLKMGENGKGVGSRWYPETLAVRIEAIGRLAPQVTFLEADGVEIAAGLADVRSVAVFADPPYSLIPGDPGSRLYRHFQIDHVQLLSTMSRATGPWLATYHCTELLRSLVAAFQLESQVVQMQNAHNKVLPELLIFGGKKPSVSNK